MTRYTRSNARMERMEIAKKNVLRDKRRGSIRANAKGTVN
jgi:hypothetical protein